MPKLPDIHFGEVSETIPDELPEIDDKDDDELEEVSQDFIDILGFDPLENDNDDTKA